MAIALGIVLAPAMAQFDGQGVVGEGLGEREVVRVAVGDGESVPEVEGVAEGLVVGLAVAEGASAGSEMGLMPNSRPAGMRQGYLSKTARDSVGKRKGGRGGE